MIVLPPTVAHEMDVFTTLAVLAAVRPIAGFAPPRIAKPTLRGSKGQD
jgi:hypothetical protein